ncbi:hypothetical protein [Streptomyces hygroscopicus]|uniref:hypothetical protein n=1 Tax=Streptomyces hygroscopicus TaxID=1912 RepID=UPI001F23CD1C|nr:hypothetical protein [Streptomyces hygroscopicus]
MPTHRSIEVRKLDSPTSLEIPERAEHVVLPHRSSGPDLRRKLQRLLKRLIRQRRALLNMRPPLQLEWAEVSASRPDCSTAYGPQPCHHCLIHRLSLAEGSVLSASKMRNLGRLWHLRPSTPAISASPVGSSSACSATRDRDGQLGAEKIAERSVDQLRGIAEFAPLGSGFDIVGYRCEAAGLV